MTISQQRVRAFEEVLVSCLSRHDFTWLLNGNGPATQHWETLDVNPLSDHTHGELQGARVRLLDQYSGREETYSLVLVPQSPAAAP